MAEYMSNTPNVRLFRAFLIAAFISSSLWWALVAIFDNQEVLPTSLLAIPFLTFVTLIYSLLLGLPWLGLIRRRSLTKWWHVTGLGFAMVSAPLLLYFVLSGIYDLNRGISAERAFRITFNDGSIPIIFLVFMGAINGFIIWIAGVRRNPYFSRS